MHYLNKSADALRRGPNWKQLIQLVSSRLLVHVNSLWTFILFLTTTANFSLLLICYPPSVRVIAQQFLAYQWITDTVLGRNVLVL